ncbi:MAG: M28 family peptidase [Planctomycetes bacterium]|nr:M28 family peptidase [Planctomycetota bacterium]
MPRQLVLILVAVLFPGPMLMAQDQDPASGPRLLEIAGKIAAQAASARRTAIETRLDELGIRYERQPFVHPKLSGTNLELRFGSGEVPALVFCAHHDIRLGSAGANDDASGCAVLVELAARLARTKEIARPIRILFLDGSQKGLLGATAWCAAQPDLLVDRVIAVDLCGRGDRLVVGSTARPFANLTATLFPTAEQLGGDLPCDHKAFVNAGLEASFLTVCPAAEIEALRRRYETRDLRAPLPATLTDALRGRDQAAGLEAGALELTLDALLAVIAARGPELGGGARPRVDFAAHVAAFEAALVAGELEKARKEAAVVTVNGLLEILARKVDETDQAARRSNLLRLIAGETLRDLIVATLADPPARNAELITKRDRIRFSDGHFRLVD